MGWGGVFAGIFGDWRRIFELVDLGLFEINDS